MSAATPASAAGDPPGAAGAGVSSEAKRYTDMLQELYSTKDQKAQTALVKEFYAPKAEFNDNVVKVYGQMGIGTQFHSLTKLFKSAEFETQSASVSEESGAKVVNVVSDQQYVFSKKPIPITVDTKLYLDSEGKVVRHLDKWRDKFASPEVIKRCTGASTTLVLRMFGLGL